MNSGRAALIWVSLTTIIAVPIAGAMTSPLLVWRQPVYVIGGFAGIVAMAFLLLQPLLVAGFLPGLSGLRGRRIHRWVGGGTVLAVVLHVAALWITSPPDVMDALLFASPTPFAVWGVIAMWALFAAAFVAAMRKRLKLHPLNWRRIHTVLTAIVVAGSVLHAVLIEGTMETFSKTVLCLFVIAAAFKAFRSLRVWKL